MVLEAALEPCGEVGEGKADADEELAEEAEFCADFVEAHFVDDFFEGDGVFGEEVDAPLPVIETDGAGDDLADFVGIAAADEAVLVHHAASLGERFAVPVDVFSAEAIHGVEADVLVLWQGGEEAGVHGVGLAVEGFADGGVPLRGVGSDVACGEGAVGL